MHPKTLATTAAALATATLLAGCGSTASRTGPPKHTASPTVAASTSTAVTPSVAPTSSAPAAAPSRTAPAAPAKGLDMTKPVDAATRIFGLWSTRSLAYEAWWARLKPYLSPAAARAYEYTDPANIPPLKIKGKLTELPGGVPDATPGLATYVAIPTDKGRFKMALERDHEGGPWIMLGLEFPPGIH